MSEPKTTVDEMIYRIIYDDPLVSAQCIIQPSQFFTLPYAERLKGYIDIIERVHGKSEGTEDLRLMIDSQKKDRRKRNDPDFFLKTAYSN